MIKTLAPSGSPIHFRDLYHCLAQLGHDPTSELRASICSSLGVNSSYLFSTGRAAMSFLLQCMASHHDDSHRNTVLVPSYTCYSVVASALKAGLKVLVCDVDESTLSYDQAQLESVEFERVLAIVSGNLYGLPDDLPGLEALARENGAYLIDDAAQCLGATIQDRPSGSIGDAGILSFDKGKVITSINGGAIVTNNQSLAHCIEKEYENLRAQSVSKRAIELIKLQAYFLLLHPALYWLPSRMPFLKLGETRYDEDYPIERYFAAMAPLATAQLSRLEEANEHRRQCAAKYNSLVPDSKHIAMVTPLAGSEPIYLRFPLRIRNGDARRKFLLDYRALGCSVSYPQSIADIPEIQHRIVVHDNNCESGRKVASELVTLPTHAYVTERDIERICRGLRTALAGSDT